MAVPFSLTQFSNPELPKPSCRTALQLSTTRLAIRNIPASWDEKRLKAAFIAGVKARATKENPVVKQVSPAAGALMHTCSAQPCILYPAP